MSFLGKSALALMGARSAQAVSTRAALPRGGDTYASADQAWDEAGIGRSPMESSNRRCGALGCTSGWMKPWKSRRRPVFEREWACSPRCMESMVRAAVLRLAGSETRMDEEPHRHRVPLGLVLLAQGWITHPQLQAALTAQRDAGEGRIGEWLTRHCGLPEERITRGLGVQWNCPVLSLESFSPRAMALVMPKRFVMEFGLVPIRVAGSSILYLAFQDRLEPSVALSLERMSDLKVESGLLTGTQLASAKAMLLCAESVPVRTHAVKDSDDLSGTIARLVENRQPIATRLVRVQRYYWLRMSLESGAQSGVGTIPLTAEDTEDHLLALA